jgi:hypothetical protein
LSNDLITPFSDWITKLLSELAFLHTVCLPVTQDTCSSESDAVSNAITADLVSAFKEIEKNLVFAEDCTPDKGFLICKIDEDGIPVPHSSPKYEKAVATSVFSPRSLIQSDTVKVYKASFPEYIAQVHKWLSLWSHILPSGKLNNPNFVEGTIKDISDEALDYLEELEQYYEETFGYLSDIHIGSILEEETRNLGKIRIAFRNYVNATLTRNESPSYHHTLKPKYTEAFRSACNDLTYTPEEIVMNLYGHACGDGDFVDRCKALYEDTIIEELPVAGVCKYGSRKLGNLLDLQIGQRIEKRFDEFEHFILSTMMEAMFYQAVCLPPALDVCPADATNEDDVDTIADARMQNSLYAIQEVQENLSEVASCACPCKSYKVTAMKTDSAVDPAPYEPADIKWFTFSIGGVTYLTENDIYVDKLSGDDNIHQRLEPLNEWVNADVVATDKYIISDSSGTISRGERGDFFGVPGHLPFQLTIREWDYEEKEEDNNLFQYKGHLSDLYESSTCGSYDKNITLVLHCRREIT